ncbi:MAG: cyclic nucleotide-binding domain-containing protein [Hyphomicrobiales bacterium]|nr:cyclic nucleotide-binding domain-containing protein [Hyphomicrobiales bacterium]
MQPAILDYHDSRKTDLPAATVLLHEGVRSGRLYVLASGTVEVVRGETRVAIVSEPGSIFGEMSVLLDIPHTATVRTLSPATVYVFEDAEKFLRSDPEVALVVARLLAQRLNTATTYLVDLKRQYSGQGNHLAMVSEVLASLLHQPDTDFKPGSDRQPHRAR